MNTVWLLVMSVPLINDCVILPHLPDWKDDIQVTEKHIVNITAAVTAAEDRCSGRVGSYIHQSYRVVPVDVPERARLHARLTEALRKGRACAPYFARAQYVNSVEEQPWEWLPDDVDTYEGTGLGGCDFGGSQYGGDAVEIKSGSVKVTGLTPGNVYWYQAGPFDLAVTNAGETVFGTRSFRAGTSYVLIHGAGPEVVTPGGYVGGSVIVATEIGRTYFYQPGENEVRLVNGATELLKAGWFTATEGVTTIHGTENALVTASVRLSLREVGLPGTVTQIRQTAMPTDGKWPWRMGQYVAFIRDDVRDRRFTHENKEFLINVWGNPDVWWNPASPWDADGAYVTGGLPFLTGSTVLLGGITGYPTPSETVYRTARVIDDTGTLPAYWSNFVGGYIIDLEVGKTYYYKKGNDPDEIGMVIFPANSNHNTTVLLESGTFKCVSTVYPFAIIGFTGGTTNGAPGGTVLAMDQFGGPTMAGYMVGTIREAKDIQCVLPGFIRGVEVNVRIHLAEIQGLTGIGGTERCQFSVKVNGTVAPRIEPFVLAGNTNRAVTLDFRVLPDEEGMVTIIITPLAPFFRACLGGVEAYQYTWEIVELRRGTGDNKLVWWDYLKGYYRKNTAVYPVIFGTPRCESIKAITNYFADVRISIEEPVGRGDLWVPTCVEVCKPDPAIPFPNQPILPAVHPYGDLLPGGTQYGPYFEFPGQPAWPVGYEPMFCGDPPSELWDGVLEQWVAAAWSWWEAYKEANNIVPTAERLTWWWNESPSLPRYHPNFVWGLDPPEYVTSSWSWEIWVDFTV